MNRPTLSKTGCSLNGPAKYVTRNMWPNSCGIQRCEGTEDWTDAVEQWLEFQVSFAVLKINTFHHCHGCFHHCVRAVECDVCACSRAAEEEPQMNVWCFDRPALGAWRYEGRTSWTCGRYLSNDMNIYIRYQWHLFKWKTDDSEQIEEQLRGAIRRLRMHSVCSPDLYTQSLLMDTSEDINLCSLCAPFIWQTCGYK